MPPVREASTKPIAATVLPAPVACSNQKRREAPGSSGCSGSCSSSSSSSSSAAGSQSTGSSSSGISSSPSSSSSPEGSSSTARLPLPFPFAPFPLPFWISASSAISVPDRASTWWAFSVVPSARCGSSSESSRSRPSMSEYSRRHSTDGSSRPASISARASSSARRRAVPWARTSSRASPSCTNGSRVNSSARRRSSSVTDDCDGTEVLSAMRLWVSKRGERSLTGCRTSPNRQLRVPMSRRPERDGGGVARPLP